jgi:tetratricopeptide (TPR) repeat protein
MPQPQVFAENPDKPCMTMPHQSNTVSPGGAIASNMSNWRKVPIWLWVLVACGVLEMGAILLGLGGYYLYIHLPETRFAQTYEAPWKTSNVNGMNFHHRADFKKARHSLLNSIQTGNSRHDPVPHFLLAELYNTTYETRDAIQAYRHVIRLGEESWFNKLAYRNFLNKAHAALALLYYEQEKPKAVLAELNAISNLSETESPSLLRALKDCIENPDRADFHMLLGKELRQHLKLALAAREMKTAVRLSQSPQLRLEAVNYMKTQMPKQLKDLSPLARYFSLAGEAHQYQHDDLERAADYYKLATAEMPDYEWGYNELAIIHREKRDFARAIEYANRAIHLNPNFYNPYLTLGDIALDQENYQQAIRYFETAQNIIRRLPCEDADSLAANIENQIGYAYELLEQPELAAQHYQNALMTSAEGVDEDSADDYDYAQEGLSRVKELPHQKLDSSHLSWQQ